MTAVRQPREMIPVVFALLTLGCGDDPTPAAAVTYTHDVVPIFDRYCISCHGSSAFAPFALLSYDEAYEHGPQVVVAVKSRKMPPCVQEDESCGPSADEIEVLTQWVAQGRVEGSP